MLFKLNFDEKKATEKKVESNLIEVEPKVFVMPHSFWNEKETGAFKSKFITIDQSKIVIEPEVKVKDIFIIENEPDLVAEILNVYDLCKCPFFYAIPKVEMLSWLQPHSVDIAITKLNSDTWKKELEGICAMLGFRSSIYILDNEGTHTDAVESWLQRKGYKVSREGRILDFLVVEYEKGYELSIIDCFNPLYTMDIFSIVFINTIGFSDIIYCDVPELIDIFYHGMKQDKNIFMPLPFGYVDYITNYLDSKVEDYPANIDEKLQIKLF
jgi:hypothetical protein